MLADKLNKGDTIAVISPSNPFIQDYKDNFNKAVNFFETEGFKVKIAKNVFCMDNYSAGTTIQRAEDINESFRDKEVKAIISLQGGNTANGVLPYLDYELIKKNPKIFMGLSDITVLLNAIYTKTGLVTYHGNDWLWGFGENMTEYDTKDFRSAFLNGNRTEIKPVETRKSIRNGIAEGKLLGGNLRCLLKLAGTSYFPDFSNSILFIETLNGKPQDCDYMFEQLKQIGVMDKINGAVVGYVKGMQKGNFEGMQMEDVLLKVTEKYSFPIIKCNDFGHKNSNAIMPIGVKVRMDTKDCSIRLIEKEIN